MVFTPDGKKCDANADGDVLPSLSVSAMAWVADDTALLCGRTTSKFEVERTF